MHNNEENQQHQHQHKNEEEAQGEEEGETKQRSPIEAKPGINTSSFLAVARDEVLPVQSMVS